MTRKDAEKYLRRALKSGYIAYHHGICYMVQGHTKSGREIGYYGINIDGDGCDGRNFGRPEIIWDSIEAEGRFPQRREAPDAKRI